MHQRPLPTLIAALTLTLLAACGPGPAAKLPAPQEVTGDSIAEFCNMTVDEHGGPKGQIFVANRVEPYWFASVRDAFVFTMLPEAPTDIVAFYVNDMAKAANWDRPEPGTWIEARKAVFVVNSDRRGGMGTAEAIPFSDPGLATAFVAKHGGRAVSFDKVPQYYPLQEIEQTAQEQAPAAPGRADGALNDADQHPTRPPHPIESSEQADHHAHR